jgi:uncharacterized protein (TIGR03066 family)
MRTLLALVVFMALCPFAPADDKKDVAKATKDKLVGLWLVTKGDSLKGATFEFTKDSKVIMKATEGGETISKDATFETDGSNLSVTHRVNNTESTDKLKIKKLTDKELVIENNEGKVFELSKK